MTPSLALFAVVACAPSVTPVELTPLWPYPSEALIDDEGHVDLPDDLPRGATPLPVDRLAWRTGFSVVQTAVVDVTQELDPTSLPGRLEATDQGSVRLVDLTDGAAVPCMAELDAWPEPEGPPVLLVRPLRPLLPGHDIAVVVTHGVRTADGAPLAVPGWWQAALDGHLADRWSRQQGRLQELAHLLDDLGVDDVAWAFRFPVADGTAGLRAMLAATAVPATFTFEAVQDADLGDHVPPRTWRQARGTVTVEGWLREDGLLDHPAHPTPAGTAEADLFVHVPESVRQAEPGTAPVWLFGHGIFSSPQQYLALDDDPQAVLELADAAGAIVVASTWRGLTSSDLDVPVLVGGDFGRFPELTELLMTGVAHTSAVAQLARDGALLDDPLFDGRASRGGLLYYGISLGGIEGAVLAGATDLFEASALHVGGSAWSTMLERSSNWTGFEPLVVDHIPHPADRQLLYAVSQLLWDPVDPAGYALDLRGRPVLWQESVGDEQVPNLTTELLWRGVDATLLEPSEPVAGVPSATGPLAGPAVARFDPLLPWPEEQNRPAATTGAHTTPRHWAGARDQVLAFLDPASPGRAVHTCGDAPCTAENPGD